MHSYQKDTIARPFSGSNTGTFFRQNRFHNAKDPADDSKVGGSLKSLSPGKVNSGNRSLGSGGRGISPDLMADQNLNFTTKMEGDHSSVALKTIQ